MRRHLKPISGLYTCMHTRAQVQPPPRVHPLTKGGGREERWRGGGRKIEDKREKRRKGGGEAVSYLYAPTPH